MSMLEQAQADVSTTHPSVPGKPGVPQSFTHTSIPVGDSEIMMHKASAVKRIHGYKFSSTHRLQRVRTSSVPSFAQEKSIPASHYKPGDIVVFLTDSGEFKAGRILQVSQKGLKLYHRLPSATPGNNAFAVLKLFSHKPSELKNMRPSRIHVRLSLRLLTRVMTKDQGVSVDVIPQSQIFLLNGTYLLCMCVKEGKLSNSCTNYCKTCYFGVLEITSYTVPSCHKYF